MYATHARVRMQQRGIQPHVVELLLDYGERVPAHRDAEIFYFGNRGRSRVRLKEGLGPGAPSRWMLARLRGCRRRASGDVRQTVPADPENLR